jgi:hypothetical protein
VNVDEALERTDKLSPDDPFWLARDARALAAEVRRLRAKLARLGPYPLEAAWKNENGEPDQFMFRRPDGGLVVLTRDRGTEVGS